MISILQLMALGNSNEVQLTTTDESGEQRFLEIDRVSSLLDTLNPKQFRYRRLLYGGLNNPIELNIRPDLVYNNISDVDRCSKALERAQHDASNKPYPFINHPAILHHTRPDKLLQIAADIEGITMPKCIRITPRSLADVRNTLQKNDLHAPLLFTEAGTDPDRKNSLLLESLDNIHELERFAFDGRNYYVTEFVDYRSNDGLFRKYRFYIIGDKILPGHLIISGQWEIQNDKQAHTGMEQMMKEIDKEEQTFLKTYLKKRLPALISLQEKIELDFYAVDCSIEENGDLLIFNVDCGAHYLDADKEKEYYSTKQIKRFNEAVETMMTNKIKKQQVRHA